MQVCLNGRPLEINLLFSKSSVPHSISLLSYRLHSRNRAASVGYQTQARGIEEASATAAEEQFTEVKTHKMPPHHKNVT